VSHRAYVHVRLGSLVFLLGHTLLFSFESIVN
jgi:hypothetical protein